MDVNCHVTATSSACLQDCIFWNCQLSNGSTLEHHAFHALIHVAFSFSLRWYLFQVKRQHMTEQLPDQLCIGNAWSTFHRSRLSTDQGMNSICKNMGLSIPQDPWSITSWMPDLQRAWRKTSHGCLYTATKDNVSASVKYFTHNDMLSYTWA